MKNFISRLLFALKYLTVGKICSHGGTSWYICPKCKEEHPEWAPFEGEGPYNPNL